MRIIEKTLTAEEVRQLRHAAAVCAGENARCVALATAPHLEFEQLVALKREGKAAIESCELLRWLAGDREDRP